jgi:cell division cycle 2-like protein
MASKASRWANAAEDAELDAKLKREKEEKRRRKQEKAAAAAAAKLEAERQDDRPSKRRKLTPDPTTTTTNGQSTDGKDLPQAKLLRFERGGWGMARSVEEYDKLNDIEEGTYGWVARATEKKTGEVVALKRLKLDAADRGGLPVTGLREIQILKDCRHKNVVELKEVVIGDNHSKLDKYVSLLSTRPQVLRC